MINATNKLKNRTITMKLNNIRVLILILCTLLFNKLAISDNAFPPDKANFVTLDRITVYVSDDQDGKSIDQMYYSVLSGRENSIDFNVYKMIEEDNDSSKSSKSKYLWANTCDINIKAVVNNALLIRSSVNRNESIIIFDIIDGPKRIPILQFVYDMVKDVCSKAMFNIDAEAKTKPPLFPSDKQKLTIMDRALTHIENNNEEKIYYSTLYMTEDSLSVNIYKKEKEDDSSGEIFDDWILVCENKMQKTSSPILTMSPRVVSGSVVNMGIYSTLFTGEAYYMWFDYVNDKCADDYEPDFYD